MEFKSLKNIDSSFKYIRSLSIIHNIAVAVVLIVGLYLYFDFAEKQRNKIYISENGKTLMLYLAQDAESNRPAEAREHVRRFHELFFTVAPDKAAIESNINRALHLSDKTAFNYFKDLSEKGFYNRIVAGNINQVVRVDSINIDFDTYPFKVTTYATQRIIRQSNTTDRTLVTCCNLINTSRSDNNPQGFTIENFEVVENKNIQITDK